MSNVNLERSNVKRQTSGIEIMVTAKSFSLNVSSLKLVVPFGLLFAFAILCVHPGRFAARYEFIVRDRVWENLAPAVSKNASLGAGKRRSCDYAAIISDESDAAQEAASDSYELDTRGILVGGERRPADCAPLFSTAVIVPYRDRDEQLKRFLTYMHAFLLPQNVHYRIYVIEQDDPKPFNRAKLFNVGAAVAMAHGYPCLVLHDVDLLPMKRSNLYACTRTPRHMSSSLDKFRFNLPYEGLFGGAVSILAEQYVVVNGMSNNYFGWGAEDDDLYQRLEAVGLKPCRFDPSISAYTMMKHKPEKASSMKNNLLATARMRYSTDGLNSLKFVEKSRKLHALFTHIVVGL